MTTAAIEVNYEVLDEQEQVTHAKPRKTREAAAPAAEETDATELANVMREAARSAAKAGLELVLTEGQQRMDDLASVASRELKKVREEIAALRKEAAASKVIMAVRINDMPAVKLSTRVSPLLASVLRQARIGQRGLKWPMIMGPSGSGKTVLASQLAETFSLPFYAINGAEGVGESALYGRWTKDGFVAGPIRKAAQTGGVCLLDEFDAFNDNVLLALNTWLSSKVGAMLTCPMSGETFVMHKDCYFIAASNTNGKGGNGAYSGRNRLDMASLKRFALFELSYDTELERELCPDKALLEKLWTIRVKLQEKNAGDVVSTRDIANAYAQQQDGFTMAEVLDTLRLGMDKANQDLCKEGK